MAKRQLTPQEMADLSNMFFELTHDPKTRKAVAKLVKEKFPDRAAAFSDIELADKIEEIENRAAEKEQLAQARAIQAEIDRQAGDLGKKYTPEQVTEIRQIAERHGNAIDLNTAAVLYAHEHPAANPQDLPPEHAPGSTWEFPSVNGKDGKPVPFADFAKDPNSAARNAAYQVIGDFKKRTGLPAALR